MSDFIIGGFHLPEKLVRRMSKKEYKATSRWLRTARRAVEDEIKRSAILRICYGVQKIEEIQNA